MNKTLIDIILCGILALFIIFGFLWGIKRGLKRTAIRGGWLVLSIVLVGFLAGVISKAIITSNLLSLFNVTYNGQAVNTVADYITLSVAELGVSATNSEAIVALVVALFGLAINSIIFLVLFWILKFLLTPVYWLLCRIIVRDKKKVKETITDKKGREKVVKKRVKVKKHRLWGGLVGIFVGAICCVATLTPVVGYLNLAKSIEDKSKENGDEGIISSAIGADTYNIINDGYSNGIFNKIYTYSGLNLLTQTTFDVLSSSTYNGKQIKLSKEGVSIINIYNKVSTLEVIDVNTCTKEELDLFLDDINSLILLSFESDLIASSSELLMDIGTDIINTKININDLPAYSQGLVSALITNLSELNSDSIKTELLNVVSFAKAVNNCGVFLPLVQGTDEEPLALIKNNLTNENTTNVINKLFNLKIVNDVAPHLANAILGMVSQTLNTTYNELTVMEKDVLKTTLINITSSAVNALSYLTITDDGFNYDLNGISAIGSLLESVLNSDLVDDDLQVEIINKVKAEADKMLKEAELPEYVSTFATGVLNNLNNVTNFETEFNYLQAFVNKVNEGLDGQELNGEIDIKKLNFEKIGSGLDELEKSVLVKSNDKNLINNLIVDFLQELKANEEFKDKNLQSFDLISNNINAVNDFNWASELKLVGGMVDKSTDLMTDGDVLEQIQNNKEKFIELGAELNKLETSAIIKKEGVNAVASDILTYMADGFAEEGFDGDLKKALNILKDNIEISEDYDWENEVEQLCGFLSEDLETISMENLSDVGKKFDEILNGYTENGKIVKASKIIDKEMIDVIINSAVEDLFAVSEGSIDFDLNEIKSAFSDVDNNPENGYENKITSYESEFAVFEKTYSLVGYDFTVSSDAGDMGAIIDEIIALNSNIINKSFINNYIKDAINAQLPENSYNAQFEQVIKNILGSDNGTPNDASDDIISRLDTMTSTYASEIVALNKLYSLSTESDNVSLDNLPNSLGQSLDEIKDSQLVGDCGKIVISNALTDYATNNSKYSDIISKIKANVEVLDLSSATPYSTTLNELKTFKTTIDEVATKVEGRDLDGETSSYLNEQMANLQDLNIINVNATKEIVKFALDEVNTTIVESETIAGVELQNTTNAKNFIEAYKEYLNDVTNKVPYNDNSTTTTIKVEINSTETDVTVNKPFTKIYEYLNPLA